MLSKRSRSTEQRRLPRKNQIRTLPNAAKCIIRCPTCATAVFLTVRDDGVYSGQNSGRWKRHYYWVMFLNPMAFNSSSL